MNRDGHEMEMRTGKEMILRTWKGQINTHRLGKKWLHFNS